MAAMRPSAQALRRQSRRRGERYRMDPKSKGICLIINNYTFERGLDDLSAGKKDGELLKTTFRNLGYEVEYHFNLTAQDIKDEMKAARNEDHSDFSSFVCCINSHGDEEGVYGTDRKAVSLKAIMSYFRPGKCDTLAHKPKLFFVDACKDDDDRREILKDDRKWAPVHSDTVVGYSTLPDYEKYAGRGGSPYIKELTERLDRFKDSGMNIQELHTRVVGGLHRMIGNDRHRVAVFRSNLNKAFTI